MPFLFTFCFSHFSPYKRLLLVIVVLNSIHFKTRLIRLSVLKGFLNLKKYFKKKQLLKLDTYNLAYAVAYAAVAYVVTNTISYSVAYAVAY